MGNRYEGRVRAGPRDVFAFEPIRTPVVNALSGVGMSADLIVDLLGVTEPDVITLVRERVRNTGAPKVGAALLEWAARHEYRGNNMSKSYAASCEMPHRDFAEPKGEYALKRVPHRVNHEILQALSLWLEIDEFERRSNERSGFFESLLWVVCEDDEADRGLAHLVQLAFQPVLAIPFDLVSDILLVTVRTACERGIPARAKPSNGLSNHLSQTEWDILRRQVRPYAAPMWPSGTGDRVRDILRAAEWSGDDAAEVTYLCDGTAMYRAASRALDAWQNAKGRKDAGALAELERILGEKQDACMAMSRNLPNHDLRNAARQRIAAWLAANHPELIELVRPCGNPLGAAW